MLIIDLGANRSLSEISTWGYAHTNTNGGKNFTLRFASSTDGSANFSSSIIVTATILPRLVSVGEVTLTYRVQYGSSTTLSMLDDGSGDDAIAGDLFYTATIPPSAYDREDMVR